MSKKEKLKAENEAKNIFNFSEYKDDEIITMPAVFAKALMKQIIYDSKRNTTATSSKRYSLYTQEQINAWLKDPSVNEKDLRNASKYMYLTSMQYQRLIKYYANILDWVYIVSPLQFSENKIDTINKRETFKKQYLKVTQFLDNLDIPFTMREISKVVLSEGVFYGVKVSDENSVFIKKIEPDYCRISSIVDGVYMYSVDMSQITDDKLNFYPEIFKKLRNDYKLTGIKYQEVPMEHSFCIKTNYDADRYSVPPFAAVIPDLFTIRNRQELLETKDELDNYKLLAGTMQTDKNGAPLMQWNTFLDYYNHIEKNIGDKVGLAISPFDLKSIEFKNNDGATEVDKISQSINNYWTNSGTSGLLHGVSNSTAGVTKLAIKNDESYVVEILDQVQKQLNLYLKTEFSRTIKFKITFLPITIYNRSEYVDMYKASVPFGIGKSQYIASLGIRQNDIEGLSFLEDNVLNLDKNLKPLINSHNASSEDLAETGRPELDDEDLSDSGESTRANDSNENR